jgi:succinate dehydrogenase/fumarate reductase flavoprotein subunit
MSSGERWREEAEPVTDTYDVVVLGTGAAGLTAALAAASDGASVGLFEKSGAVGGTTALSGGIVWLPANRLAAEAGVTDSRDDALRYLDSLSNGSMRPEMVTAFVDGVAPLLDWLEAETPLQLRLVAGYPDYHPEHPGGLPDGGRSLEPELFGTDVLGAWAGRLVGGARRFYIGDIPSGGGSGVLPEAVLRERSERNLEGLGRGLVGALLSGCLDRGIEPQLQHRAVELRSEAGRVRGVRFETPSGPREVTAGAVVLATGGFEWDAGLVRDFLRGPVECPPGVATNTGDGLTMAMGVGARLGGMPYAWWVPVVTPPGRLRFDGEQEAVLLLRERTLPGTIMVNRTGRRFANEAANYNALGAAFHAFDVTRFRYANLPAWLVLDRRCVEQYGVFGAGPGQAPPDWLVRADSLAELAAAIDVPADALERTVERWNDSVHRGQDDEFGRGESVYDGWCGDRAHYRTPQATLGTVAEPPFFATRVHASTLGTKGGPATTPDGQVLGVGGGPIDGLYAAGNVMAAPTGMVYGGAGGTLGPAMVFALRAGRHAAAARVPG